MLSHQTGLIHILRHVPISEKLLHFMFRDEKFYLRTSACPSKRAGLRSCWNKAATRGTGHVPHAHACLLEVTMFSTYYGMPLYVSVVLHLFLSPCPSLHVRTVHTYCSTQYTHYTRFIFSRIHCYRNVCGISPPSSCTTLAQKWVSGCLP